MDHVKYFNDLFESIPDYRKIVLLLFLIKNENVVLQECGYLKNDINRLCLDFGKIKTEQKK